MQNDLGWNNITDPCIDTWVGIGCDSKNQTVRKIVLDELNFTGSFDASSVCTAQALIVLSLNRNSITGLITEEIGNCKSLTHLYLSGNKLSGDIPNPLSELSNLKRLDISNNSFSGQVSSLSRISGLKSFLVQNNQLSGAIPNFDFSNLEFFNVSNNNFRGPIPDVKGKFKNDSFLGNPELCGKPLSNACPPPVPPPSEMEPKRSSKNGVLIYSGYIILALVLFLLYALKLLSKHKPKAEKIDSKEVGVDTSSKPSGASGESKPAGNQSSQNRSEYSITSAESGGTSSSLVLLTSPFMKELRFEDLLRAPAELLGKGKHGSLYKVLLNDGMMLTVKRIKDWGVSSEDFKKRMERIHQVKHPTVLPPVAFYCSKQEKLLVYEYQPNGSLFKLLHGSQNGQVFDWGSRLSVAAIIAETLAILHQELREDGIAHGNLKSTNILFNNNMEPCISEYGLMEVENQDQPFISQTTKHNTLSRDQIYSTFKVDVYAFGVILLELLTGKLVQNNGFDLARWVHSVVREEWTAEVFDKALISEGASEERMVNLLQVALKCINPSPNERPVAAQIAVMINAIKNEEERSIISEP
ncbi:hypothetical protein JCGZ_11506 [Jatropha curcas]|uniref:Protein kinase domain-containing protein n=2 Tax=Jatropha curcas TaxID=180498 RepID=A0A067KFU8_JATCU|nr:hypothetical protein JCGZ_11506 [Jatropha curcas]